MFSSSGLKCIALVALVAAIGQPVATGDDALHLADFIIAGTQKGGTSSLYMDVLAHHSQIAAAKHGHMETHYFDECAWAEVVNASLSLQGQGRALRKKNKKAAYQQYTNCSAEEYASVLRQGHKHQGPGENSEQKYLIDKSPDYMFFPWIPSRIRRVAPAAKIIFVLRDPVTRAYSHYSMTAHRPTHRHLTGNFSTMVLDQIARFQRTGFADNQSLVLQNPSKVQAISFISRGLYAEQLEPFFGLFPADQLLVLFAEELWKTNDYSALSEFMQLDPPLKAPTSKTKHKKMSYTFKEPEMATTMKETLQNFYARPNKALCALLMRNGASCPPWTEYSNPPLA